MLKPYDPYDTAAQHLPRNISGWAHVPVNNWRYNIHPLRQQIK
jgi:hypothetical protein